MFIVIHNTAMTLCQARRQDFAAGGAKNHKGVHFLNIILDVCSNRGAKHEMGAQILNGGPGTTGLPAGDGPTLCTVKNSVLQPLNV